MRRFQWRTCLLAGLASLALAGCGGEDAGTSPTVSDVPLPAPAPGTPPASPGDGNTAPVITGTPATTATAGSFYEFRPTASDIDGTALTFSVQGLPAWLSLNAQNGAISGTPTNEDAGETADITLSVTDGEATTALPTFRIAVAAVTGPTPPPVAGNQAPTISGTPPTSVTATSTYTFTPVATDADSTNLRFTISNKPSWASFSSTTGRLSGTPTRSHVRTYSNIVIRVSDGALSASLPAFSIVVNAAPNAAPIISGTPATSVTAGSAYTFTPVASDADGQALGFTIANKPSWATFNTSNGRLSGTPGTAAVGSYADIRISVSDGTTTASLPAFPITVNAASNGAPTISGTPATGVVAGSAYSFTPQATDPNGDTLTFSVSGRPSWASFNTSNGALTGTPTAAQIGSYGNIVISVSDGTTSRSLPAFAINVTSPGTGTGTATLNWTAPTQNTDGSALTNLTGYRVYHGTSQNALNDVRTIASPGITTYVFDTLAAGTHYFAVAAVNSAGVESALSGVGSKTIN